MQFCTGLDIANPVCPKCYGQIDEIDTTICQCCVCGIRYPVTLGIKDLRYPQPRFQRDGDLDVVYMLKAHYAESNYAELMDIFFSCRDFSHLPDELLASRRQHRVQQLERASRLTDMFLERVGTFSPIPLEKTLALEVGCGAGAGLVRLADIYHSVVGLDPSLPDLILAKKLCDERGLDHVHLVQAYGQHLPFHSGAFNYITAQNVLEHMMELLPFISEVVRVLHTDGGFAADSRNRYDLFLPEPHVKIRWVGLLPRRWAAHYVRWRTGIETYADHVCLLSYRDLRDALMLGFGEDWRIEIPEVASYGMSPRLDRLLGFLTRHRWMRRMLLAFFPSHLAIARKV